MHAVKKRSKPLERGQDSTSGINSLTSFSVFNFFKVAFSYAEACWIHSNAFTPLLLKLIKKELAYLRLCTGHLFQVFPIQLQLQKKLTQLF